MPDPTSRHGRLPRDGIRPGTTGGRVRARRLKLGMDKYAFADATGLSLSFLSQVETYHAVKITPHILGRLSRALGCRPEDLTGKETDHVR